MITDSVKDYRKLRLLEDMSAIVYAIFQDQEIKACIEKSSYLKRQKLDLDSIRAEIKKIEGAK